MAAISSKKQALRRWLAIVLSGVVAAPTVLLALREFGLVPKIVGLPVWSIFASGVIASASLFWLGWGRLRAFFGLRHLLSYPPLWLAGIVGVSTVVLALALVEEISRDFGLSPVPPWFVRVGILGMSAVAVLFAARLVLMWKEQPVPCVPTDAAREPAVLGSFAVLCEWLRSDDAVFSSDQDAFAYQAIAKRIATRLVSPRPPAQAVVGALGAGKSSLRNLVSAELSKVRPQGCVEIVPVELWSYDSTKAAVQGVIAALIDALARRVNVVAVRGIPAAYAEAVSASGGLGAALMHIQGPSSSPADALTEIDSIATAIGVQYVVWIEELERFAGGAAGDLNESPEETERLAPIRALLTGLDRLASVTVVTATTSLVARFDLEKIARYVEKLPDLPEADVAKVLELFRAGCYENFPFIDPSGSEARLTFDSRKVAARRIIAVPGFGDLGEALPALARTPRALKQGLRSCLEIWEALAGEVDFGDALAMSLLRAASPGAFATVERHADALRGGRNPFVRSPQEAREQALKELEQAVDGEQAREAIRAVVDLVFAAVADDDKPQGFAGRRHTDYWLRFLTATIPADERRDQLVLRAMAGDDDPSLLSFVMNKDRSGAVENFSSRLDTPRVRRLLALLTHRLSTTSASEWNTTGNTFNDKPPGLVPLWRILLDRSRRGQFPASAVLEDVKNAYDVLMPTNLDAVDEVEHWFVTGDGDQIDFFRDNGQLRQEAKQDLRQKLVAVHRGKPNSLATALDGAAAPVLLRLCWGLERVRAKAFSGIPFEGWDELRSTILDAARAHPRVLLPQVACLVCSESTVDDEIAHRYQFDAELAARLFGSVEAVLDVFVGSAEAFPDEPRVREVVASAAARLTCG